MDKNLQQKIQKRKDKPTFFQRKKREAADTLLYDSYILNKIIQIALEKQGKTGGKRIGEWCAAARMGGQASGSAAGAVFYGEERQDFFVKISRFGCRTAVNTL